MTKLKNKEYKIKYKHQDAGFDFGVYITYIDGEYEKMVYFTQLEHQIKFTDLLKEAGYTYVDLTPCDATTQGDGGPPRST